ncbi:hypothetical protein L313_2311 [Acinetobacter haemolyticus CIP 64.3 = MTCC 9819]|nr:hypothetical protein L313_2311 [Acinetobacter haemolyticus CIP 64.3 = MTCC 9819]
MYRTNKLEDTLEKVCKAYLCTLKICFICILLGLVDGCEWIWSE